MLKELNIRNFAIIDELQVTFAGGLNIISGETGAGKSIIIGAVGLLLGDRANADMIRSFEDSAVVEALFDVGGQEKLQREIREMGFVDGEDLVVRRVVSRSGKNRVYINGALAPLSSLAALGESLINICGQHEHQLILNPESHADVLDEFGELLTLRSAYREAYDRYRSLNERRRALEELRRKKEEREDLLRFQMGEISGACVRAGEDAALAEEKKVLANVQRLMDFASAAYETLYGKSGSVLAELRGAAAAVKEIRKIDASLGVAGEDLDEIYYRLEDAAFVLRDYQKRLSFEPAHLEEVDERLELLGRLKRKYGGTLETVLKRQAEAEGELANIASLEEETEVLTREIAREKERVLKAAGDLSVKRRAAAAALEAAVEAEIRTLRMANARFAVIFRDPLTRGGEEQLNEKGADDLEFYLSANVGEEMKPLRGIASGGELSRIMLALKKVLARTGSVGTIVFDEVDSGIGGATAEIVGQKLREVARHHQILCITHLPQIACCGDRHYLVAKRVAGERTNTSVVLLAEEGRQEEIARMLGGVEMTEKTREHAREMLVAARG
ncbi:MAG: DNA repair protein RecN [Proteobacteria bacterium]|nr:DNA repair protein RecN [Pseudomonadota bacterium]MBU2226961.1 DNA repair protein RecN [Pseudomonadota bacterium]MBU2260511.1 DNA repair protein RecN [Pseudomonadota bacterium]